MNTPDSNVIEFINNIKKLNEGLVDEYNLNLKYETLKESLEYFRLNNIGFYKLKDFVVDILSKKQTIVPIGFESGFTRNYLKEVKQFVSKKKQHHNTKVFK
jgi:hypothetical protein